MANDEVIGPRKTMFVLVIVVGCFAVLWPRILSPLVLGPTREQIQPNQFDREAGCCEVIFETDVAVLELVNEVCSSALEIGKSSSQSAAECRKAVNDTCGVDIAVFLKRNENVGKTTKMLVETMQNSNSSCLREHFGVPIYSLGPHLAAKAWNIKDTLKQERAPPMRGLGPHPALRERGRAIPPLPPGPPPPASRPVTLPPHVRVRSPLSVYYENEQPPPIPGMRPPLGSPGGPVPAPKSSMGFVMPIYTICIIVFFVYTLTKILFRRQGAPYDPVAPDPQFRRRVFRDDSRSSPEKLGKKEADTIVTAISGLVAEVQQQMEASAAPDQQRQDVQDNARPYTNGTILLNSGPVQIVTSEYKEATKEKTPEPTNEKDSTPEPIEAEVTKVDKEPCPEVDEPAFKPKEHASEVKEPSPDPEITPEQNKATLGTVVIEKSSPEPTVTEECKAPTPDLIDSIQPMSSNDFNVDSIPKLSDISSKCEESVLTSELKDSTAHLKQSTLELDVLSDLSPESTTIVVENIPLTQASKDVLISNIKDSLLELRESSPDLKESSPESMEFTSESKKLSTDLVEPFVEVKESSTELLKSTSESKLNPLVDEGLITDIEKPSLLSKDPIPEHVSPYESQLEEPLIEPLIEPKELTPEIKDPSRDIIALTLEPKEVSKDSESIVQPPLEPEVQTSELKDPSVDIITSVLESKESSLHLENPIAELIEPTPEPEESLSETQESVPGVKESPDTKNSDLPILATEQSILEPVVLVPEHQAITTIIDQSIPQHDESATHKKLTPELELENSQESKAPILESSPDPDITENSPKLEAPIVECSPEPEFTENTPEVDAPGIQSNSDLKTESVRLKEPTPQSKETTPERQLTPSPKSSQVEETASVPQGTLLDLEEAIADIDDAVEKQQENAESIKTDTTVGDASEELLKVFESKDAVDSKDELAKASDKLLEGERFVVVRRSTPDVIEENKKICPFHSNPIEEYKLYTEADEEDVENAAVKVMGMEMTAHPVDGSEWPRDERPPPAAPASPPPRPPHAAEDVKSIFLETEIPQQSRVLVAQFQEDRPRPASHAPLVVSGKMTLSLIQDAPRETPERDPESTLDEFTTASAVTQPAAEKGEIESDEEIDEEIEVEEIELEEEEEEEEEPPPAKAVSRK